VTDQQTNEPVNAVVTFDSVEVGETGGDGTLWVIPLNGTHTPRSRNVEWSRQLDSYALRPGKNLREGTVDAS